MNRLINMHRLREQIEKQVASAMQTPANTVNVLALPKLVKITVNIGLGKAIGDPGLKDVAVKTLERITGQKPILTKAKKSISNFKIREGMVVGAKVTLRGNRMYDFLDKMRNVALPRVRDFRGLKRSSVDSGGNLTIGFREHTVFPEIRSDEIEKVHGLEVVLTTTAGNREKGLTFFESLGIPFEKND